MPQNGKRAASQRNGFPFRRAPDALALSLEIYGALGVIFDWDARIHTGSVGTESGSATGAGTRSCQNAQRRSGTAFRSDARRTRVRHPREIYGTRAGDFWMGRSYPHGLRRNRKRFRYAARANALEVKTRSVVAERLSVPTRAGQRVRLPSESGFAGGDFWIKRSYPHGLRRNRKRFRYRRGSALVSKRAAS